MVMMMMYCLLQLVAYQRMDQRDQPPPRVLLLRLHSCCCHLRHAGRNSQQVVAVVVVMSCCCCYHPQLVGIDEKDCYLHHCCYRQAQVNRHHPLAVVVVDAAMGWFLSVTPIICASIIVSFFFLLLPSPRLTGRVLRLCSVSEFLVASFIARRSSISSYALKAVTNSLLASNRDAVGHIHHQS